MLAHPLDHLRPLDRLDALKEHVEVVEVASNERVHSVRRLVHTISPELTSAASTASRKTVHAARNSSSAVAPASVSE